MQHRRRSRGSLVRWIIWGVFLISWAAATKHVASHPGWNLDGVFYSALMHTGTATAEVVHRRVYEELEAHVPADAAAALTHGSEYREKLRGSVGYFDFQLPFYVSKPLYVWLGKLFTLLGVLSIVAPYAVSLLGFAALGLLLPWLAIGAGARPLVAAAVAGCGVWLPELRGLGTLATPDAIATALLLLGALLVLSKPQYALLPLVAAVLARPDAVIFACAVVCAGLIHTQTRCRMMLAVVSSVLLLAIAWAVVPLTGAYAWPTVMRHTFMERVLDEHARALGFGLSDYLAALARGWQGHMTDHPTRFMPYLAVAVLAAAWAMRRQHARRLRPVLVQLCSDRSVRALVGVWLATVVHFFALPLLADRFFAFTYVCTVALSCALLFPAVPELPTCTDARSSAAGLARDSDSTA